MTSCRVCLDEIADGPAHPRCLEDLFGERHMPDVDLDLARLHTVALATVGKASMSGVQRKISVRLADGADRRDTLHFEFGRGRFILKPQAGTFPHLPENEHLTMRLAAHFGLTIPPCGLLPLRDGTEAYIVRRFDRDDGGKKYRQEDFCQLAEKSPKEKYEGSAELAFRLLRRYAAEPGIAALELYKQFLFSWWVGNGDAHLKNFSLLEDQDGRFQLSPAYDLVSTVLVIPDDQLALPIIGKKSGLTKKTWLELARYAAIPERAAARVLARPAQILAEAKAAVERSYLPEPQKTAYTALITDRAALV